MTRKPAVRADFRRDIGGLRAWAVTAVVLYHFGIPGFRGGFIGVDVFFVISGFLMTGIVVKGLERGSFSVLDFYLARARRIAPALLVLCAVLLGLGWFVLLPPDYRLLSTHSTYAVTFLSNVEFWLEAGYFDVASHEKWLLHTWSLSVEWQFYLLLPLAMSAIWRVRPGRSVQIWAVAIGLASSLAASIWITKTQPSAAFYLLHTRAWEMLAGALVFLFLSKATLSTGQRGWSERVGLLLIVIAIVVFDKNTVWPGWRAVVPVAATVLVLMAGRDSRWTGSALAQWLGDRSYSLYLWHWPVYVALVYVDLKSDPLAIALALVLTAALGHLSYVWVENPSRRFLERRRPIHAGAALAFVAAGVALPALGIWTQLGVAGRFSPTIEAAAAESTNFNRRREECHVSKGLTMPSCVYGGTDWKVIVLGDSHAGALMTGIAEAQPKGEAGAVQWSYSGCVFELGLKKSTATEYNDYKCSEFIALAQSRLKSLPAAIPVVIINRYAAAVPDEEWDRGQADVATRFFSKAPRPTSDLIAGLSESIVQSACQLAQKRPVYMVRPIPEMGFDVPKTLSRRMVIGLDDDLSIPMAAYRERTGWVWAAQDAARDKCGIQILDPTRYLCRDGRCYASVNGRPLYHDDNHLSEFGNKALVPMFAEVFQAKQFLDSAHVKSVNLTR